jgi:hypothetical protein
MTEEKKPKIDRLYVDKKDFDDFNRLKEKGTPFTGVHNHQLFVVAMVLGYSEGCRIELKNRKEFFFEKDLTKEENAIIKALAVGAEGNLNVLLDKQKIYTIAEQYATGGISLLKAKVFSGDHGSYAKKLESDLLRAFEKTQIPKPEAKTEKKIEGIPLEELVCRDESDKLEFKSSMVWDVKQKRANKELKIAIAKEIAAFMNAKGGILLIGVDDDKTVSGIEKDLAVLHNSQNEFELTLTNLIRDNLGKVNRNLVELKINKIGEKKVAVVWVKESPHPVYVKAEGRKEEFCTRAGNSCQTLEVSEASLYIKEHWPDLR